ncbi:microtubule-associated protein 70-5-like [Rutidosis leptorrhynchoides]|uniref:microtubule-associated protein 70-5-like n=1 Tax=Rutidosis leptorrhynchoides TaxID=125765 RepID=UPI003A9A1904
MVGFEKMLKGGNDPFVFELNRLQNQLKEKERELGVAQNEIKALRTTDVSKDKAIKNLRKEVNKLDLKLGVTRNVLEHKNLEIKKLTNEKKEALSAQYVAEATLRRVHASQMDDDNVPIELIIAPLQAEIKMCRSEITALQDDKKAMERLTKSKESALLEAERLLKSALERALSVEKVQNQNFELKRQIEICQEENKILEKTNQQKVSEIEMLSQRIQELEEAILAAGAMTNTIRDYQRRISELQEEKRALERELARIKVSANRVASVAANEWKDENDKVMPVKQWLEERRLMQAGMERLRDKLTVLERTAKTEAQLKEKLKMRVMTLEEVLLNSAPKTGKGHNILGYLKNNTGLKKHSLSQKKGILPTKNKVIDQSWGKENAEADKNTDTLCKDDAATVTREIKSKHDVSDEERQNEGSLNSHSEEDIVSGFLYDRLQKEVISLRKLCQVKDGILNCKDEEIMVLVKKVETLTKIVSKKVKREATFPDDGCFGSCTDEIRYDFHGLLPSTIDIEDFLQQTLQVCVSKLTVDVLKSHNIERTEYSVSIGKL